MRRRHFIGPVSARLPALPLLASLLVAAGGCGGDVAPELTLDLAEIARTREVSAELRLDFTDEQSRSHLVSGWARNPSQAGNGEQFLWALGGSSSLAFPAFEIRDLEMIVRIRPAREPEAAHRNVAVALNGQPVGTLELEPGRRQYRLVLPDAAQVPGENRLRFDYDWIPTSEGDETPAGKKPRTVAWYHLLLREPGLEVGARDRDEPADGRLRIGVGGRQDYFLRPPPGSRLELEGVRPEGADEGRLRVVIEEGRDDSAQTVTRELLLEEDDRVREPLVAEGSTIVRLSLHAEAVGGHVPGSRLSLGRAAIVWPAEPEVVAQTTVESEEPRGQRPHVLIYLIDTLRADRIGAYDEERALSPNIDALASEGIVVDRALTHAPWTRPSMGSLMTGLWPYAHDVNSRRSSMPPGLATMAELLRAGGYHTAGFISNPQVSESFGFNRGFEEYFELREGGDAYLRDSSRLLFESVDTWLESGRPDDKPLFLYVHTIDPHAPYTPHGEFRERFAADVEEATISPEESEALAAIRERLGRHTYLKQGDLDLGSMPWVIGLEDGVLDTDEREVADLERLYDAEVAINDAWFGALAERLREAGLWDDMLVVVTSDHGEEFGEHGHWEHSTTLYSNALEVPLIFKLPRGAHGGDETAPGQRLETAQLVDVLPTVLSVAGLPVPGHLEGSALFGEARTPEDGLRPAFSYLSLHGARSTAVVEGRWKLILTLGEEIELELYDLDEDSGEEHDLSEQRPLLVGYLRDLILRQQILHPPISEAGTATIDEETRQRLEALGYI